LDYAAKRVLANQLDLLRDEKRSVLLATHDIEFVAMVADRVLVLKEGLIIQDSSPLEVLGHGSELASQVAEVTNEPGLITIGQILK
jgi:energy-coupling factor transport system ATP-binding protein